MFFKLRITIVHKWNPVVCRQRGYLTMKLENIVIVRLLAVCLILFTQPLLTACASRQNLDKDQWLQTNFPNRAKNLAQSGNQHSAFRDTILAGQVSTGMNLDEILIARAIAPYGPALYRGKFWCGPPLDIGDNCPKHCSKCQGIIKTKNDILLLQRHSGKLIAVAHKKHGYLQSSHGITQTQFDRAEALFKRQYVMGK